MAARPAIAIFGAAIAAAALAEAAGTAGPVTALAPEPPGARARRATPGATAACARGPCASPSAIAFLTGGGGGAGGGALAVTNFGLVQAEGGGGWSYVCDDVYGTPRPELVRGDGRGRLFAAGSSTGLLGSADGCAWSAAAGAVAEREVLDLAFDGTPGRVWALAGAPGVAERVLARSDDGGASFAMVHAFADGLAYARLLVAPSDSRRLYLAGRGQGAAGVSVPLARSDDGGATWTTRDLAAGRPAPLENPLVLLAVAPDDPDRLFFSLVDALGDEIWLSDDGGRSVRRVLEGGPRDWMTGLAFGPDGRTVYAAAAVIPVIDGESPGHLFVSRDRGESWAAPILSAATGPSYRCLEASGGTLYACDLGGPTGGAFLVGASSDEGRTWQPVVQLRELAGAKRCVRAACAATEAWLCDSYGRCPDEGDAGAPGSDAARDPADAGRDDGPTEGGAGACAGDTCPRAGGCACKLSRAGGADRAPLAPGVFAALALAAFASRRRRQLRK